MTTAVAAAAMAAALSATAFAQTGAHDHSAASPHKLTLNLNCTDVCPKGLNPARAIGLIKTMMLRRGT